MVSFTLSRNDNFVYQSCRNYGHYHVKLDIKNDAIMDNQLTLLLQILQILHQFRGIHHTTKAKKQAKVRLPRGFPVSFRNK